MVPQIDRVCITGVKDGKVVELMGPMSLAVARAKSTRQATNGTGGKGKAAKPEAAAQATGPRNARDASQSRCPTVDAEGESLADYATGDKWSSTTT